MVERSSLMRLSALTKTSLGKKPFTSFFDLCKGGNDDQVTDRRAASRRAVD